MPIDQTMAAEEQPTTGSHETEGESEHVMPPTILHDRLAASNEPLEHESENLGDNTSSAVPVVSSIYSRPKTLLMSKLIMTSSRSSETTQIKLCRFCRSYGARDYVVEGEL
jgi:hypothetical protein